MLRNLAIRIRDREAQRFFVSALAGKLLGLVALYGLMVFVTASFFAPASADTPAAAPAPYINPINTAWTLIAAFLVFFMQAGFMCLEAGFARTRESVNI